MLQKINILKLNRWQWFSASHVLNEFKREVKFFKFHIQERGVAVKSYCLYKISQSNVLKRGLDLNL